MEEPPPRFLLARHRAIGIMSKMNEANAEAAEWVERICTLVRGWPSADATIAGLFANAAPELADRAAFCRLVSARLRREPVLIDAWESFSADNRGTPCPYFRGMEVGIYDNGSRDVVQHSDRADACADYLFRRSMSVMTPHAAGAR